MNNKRVAIVTGASGGIGRAIAIQLAKDGFDVVITYNKSVEGAQATCSLLKEYDSNVTAICCDISKVSDIENMISAVIKTYGRIDVLVNNASISNTLAIEDIDEEEWDKMIDTNLKGTFFCSKYAYHYMKKSGYGRIISITSIAGERGGHFSGVHYSASKGGVATMMKCFALNGAKYGITANSVSPGVVETEMSKREGITIENIPMGRMAKPEEVAAAVSFLASESAGYITGATIDINGGQLMR